MNPVQPAGAALLSGEEVERIKREEKLRTEIRAALAPAKPTGWPNKLWDGLNSTFGIWFLTAFFVTGLGSLASKWYEQAREREQKHEAQLAEERKKREAEDLAERQRKETYERVTLEISYRYSIALAGLREASERLGGAKNQKSHDAITYAIQPLTRPASPAQPPLFKEYESYSGLALIAELRRHSGQGESNMLKEILARTGALLHEISFNKAGSTYSAKSAAAALVDRMRNSKWDNGFAYTDCKSDNPFC
jgi:hypothetical protein